MSTPVPPLGVKKPSSPPTAISAAPAASSRLRPKRSPTTPNDSSSSVTGTRNASEIQVSVVDVVCRSWLMKPLMTAGMDRPIWAMATAAAAATRVPRRSSTGVAGPEGATVSLTIVKQTTPKTRCTGSLTIAGRGLLPGFFVCGARWWVTFDPALEQGATAQFERVLQFAGLAVGKQREHALLQRGHLRP